MINSFVDIGPRSRFEPVYAPTMGPCRDAEHGPLHLIQNVRM